MKQKLSNYIAEKLLASGITDVFMITGGGAMHLDDALGHQEGLHCLYNHHEQACAMAAEAYARIHNKIAAVCVTTGPGGINAMNGVAGGFLDSIPMFVISGQVRYDTTARSTGLHLRAMGDQEYDITKSVANMTKYCEMVIDPMRIRFCVEKALYLAYNGRPGPTWLDIPLNVQAAMIETDDLIGFDPEDYEAGGTGWAAESASEIPEDTAGKGEFRAKLPARVTKETARAIIKKVRTSKRPVINAGNGIRIGAAHDVFMRVVEKLGIPVVTGADSIDCIYDEHPLYIGKGGNVGDRPGNFAIQNSDLVLSLGSRLSFRQVGYRFTTWAREAYVIVNDIDAEELKKPTLHVDLPVWGDAKELLAKMVSRLEAEQAAGNTPLFKENSWVERCQEWKAKYPVVQKKHYEDTKHTNVYAFIKELSSRLSEGQVTVVGNGSACVVGSHAYVIKKGQRFIINSAIASMGYDLPAAIGAVVAEHGNLALNREALKHDDIKDVILVTGDGSIQMNIQELQTIIHHQMPVKIFVINNQGYHSIRQTQTNLFEKHFVGIGPESGDLSFPDMGKLAPAYGYPFFRCETNAQLDETISKVLAVKGPAICEIMVSTEQKFEPKSATKRLEDGTLVSPPLEDLAPFLDRDEFYSNMIIKPIS